MSKDAIAEKHRGRLRHRDEAPSGGNVSMPPDAEPLPPASAVTVTSTLTSGLGIALSAADTDLKPANGAITPPKPCSGAVSSGASLDAGPTCSADHVLSVKAVAR